MDKPAGGPISPAEREGQAAATLCLLVLNSGTRIGCSCPVLIGGLAGAFPMGCGGRGETRRRIR